LVFFKVKSGSVAWPKRLLADKRLQKVNRK
jgi:hypothetical protein